MLLTHVVFSATSDTMALMAYTPLAVIVLISACIPAPPLQSLPAIEGEELNDAGDEQFEIADGRSFSQMYKDISDEGL